MSAITKTHRGNAVTDTCGQITTPIQPERMPELLAALHDGAAWGLLFAGSELSVLNIDLDPATGDYAIHLANL